MQRFVLLEKVTRRAPLGLRFLDLTREVPVTDGLVVTAWQLGTSSPQYTALRSPLSGIYGFSSLPGLKNYEVGERPASYWCPPSSPPGSPPLEPTPQELTSLNSLQALLSSNENTARGNFAVYVSDQMERFLPQLLLMCLPKEYLVEVPLFSSPARPAPVGYGAVRGEVVVQGTLLSPPPPPPPPPPQPASWALVTVSPDDGVTTYVAVADARGMFTLYIPYASALPPLQGSPPHGSGTIDQLTWQLTIQVFYQRSTQVFIAGIDPPDTLSILEQERANVYDQDNVPGSSLLRSISFGGDVVVATSGHSQLLVDPALSPIPP
jgi:hypothetical protein